MPTGEPSSADRRLAQELRSRGHTWVKDTHPQRWHRRGLIPTPSQTRARGLVSTYPDGTLAQADDLCRALARHRGHRKAAVILFFRGYDIDRELIRAAFLNGIVYLNQRVQQFRRRGRSEDEVAERVAAAIVDEPRRSRPAQQHRREQLRKAGHRENLVLAYKRLILVWMGETASAGGLFAAMTTTGVDVLGMPLPGSLLAFSAALEGELKQARKLGGIGRILEEHVPHWPADHFDAVRDQLLRPMFDFAEQNLHDIRPPDGLLRDCYDALRAPRS